MQIFLAEDNEDNVFIVKTNLKKIYPDAELIRAADGQEAVEMLEGGTLNPAIFLVDIAMPRLDGLGFVKWLKEQTTYKDIPAIAVTASVFAEMKESYIQHGFDMILEKPFTRKDLAAILDKALN